MLLYAEVHYFCSYGWQSFSGEVILHKPFLWKSDTVASMLFLLSMRIEIFGQHHPRVWERDKGLQQLPPSGWQTALDDEWECLGARSCLNAAQVCV